MSTSQDKHFDIIKIESQWFREINL